jgi:hypothetical protein
MRPTGSPAMELRLLLGSTRICPVYGLLWSGSTKVPKPSRFAGGLQLCVLLHVAISAARGFFLLRIHSASVSLSLGKDAHLSVLETVAYLFINSISFIFKES